MAHPWFTLRRLAFSLPLAYALHVAEEAPTFVAWFNAHVEPDITAATFWSVTSAGLVITLLAAGLAVSRKPAAVLAATAWVGCLMLANGIFHVVATVVDRTYAPGVVTAVLLYLPVSVLWIAAAAREHAMRTATVAATALIGGIPMFVHGYRIVFEGGRLF